MKKQGLSFFRIFFTIFLVLLAGVVLETILYTAKDPMFLMGILFIYADPSILLLFIIPIFLYAFLYALLMRNRMVSLKYVILFNSALVLYYVMLTSLGFFLEITSPLPYTYLIGLFIFLLAQYFLILFAKRKKETKQWFLAFGLAITSVILLYGIYGVTSSVLWSAKTEPCQYIEDTSMTVPAMKWQSPYLGILDYRDKVALEIVDQRCLLENDQQWLYFTAKVINVEGHTISWSGGLGIEGVDYVYSEAFSLRNFLPVLSYILTARDIPVLFDWDIEPGQSKIAFYNASPSSEIITISSIEQYTSLKKFPEPDLDRDGLNDEEEIEYGTNPANKDTDHDKLSDAEEIMTYQTDPNDSNSDDDGYTDYDEVHIAGTDPLDATDYPE